MNPETLRYFQSLFLPVNELYVCGLWHGGVIFFCRPARHPSASMLPPPRLLLLLFLLFWL